MSQSGLLISGISHVYVKVKFLMHTLECILTPLLLAFQSIDGVCVTQFTFNT